MNDLALLGLAFLIKKFKAGEPPRKGAAQGGGKKNSCGSAVSSVLRCPVHGSAVLSLRSICLGPTVCKLPCDPRRQKAAGRCLFAGLFSQRQKSLLSTWDITIIHFNENLINLK